MGNHKGFIEARLDAIQRCAAILFQRHALAADFFEETREALVFEAPASRVERRLRDMNPGREELVVARLFQVAHDGASHFVCWIRLAAFGNQNARVGGRVLEDR